MLVSTSAATASPCHRSIARSVAQINRVARSGPLAGSCPSHRRRRWSAQSDPDSRPAAALERTPCQLAATPGSNPRKVIGTVRPVAPHAQRPARVLHIATQLSEPKHHHRTGTVARRVNHILLQPKFNPERRTSQRQLREHLQVLDRPVNTYSRASSQTVVAADSNASRSVEWRCPIFEIDNLLGATVGRTRAPVKTWEAPSGTALQCAAGGASARRQREIPTEASASGAAAVVRLGRAVRISTQELERLCREEFQR